jgi:hypothetical protein
MYLASIGAYLYQIRSKNTYLLGTKLTFKHKN